MVEIMKASAGSGKTFNLARKYITLLFRKQDRYAYRHILAVTFTNKATDEMKRRILKELYVLASAPERSGYLKYFMVEGLPAAAHDGIEKQDLIWELPGKQGQKITLESLADSADTVLCNILHHHPTGISAAYCCRRYPSLWTGWTTSRSGIRMRCAECQTLAGSKGKTKAKNENHAGTDRVNRKN